MPITWWLNKTSCPCIPFWSLLKLFTCLLLEAWHLPVLGWNQNHKIQEPHWTANYSIFIMGGMLAEILPLAFSLWWCMGTMHYDSLILCHCSSLLCKTKKGFYLALTDNTALCNIARTLASLMLYLKEFNLPDPSSLTSSIISGQPVLTKCSIPLLFEAAWELNLLIRIQSNSHPDVLRTLYSANHWSWKSLCQL